jgi:hypothetical protein
VKATITSDLYRFDGILSLKNLDPNEIQMVVNADQFLLRGSRFAENVYSFALLDAFVCRLRNTQSIVGWAVFVGHNTREMHNMKVPCSIHAREATNTNDMIRLISSSATGPTAQTI